MKQEKKYIYYRVYDKLQYRISTILRDIEVLKSERANINKNE
jgi:hypothetical protein